MTLYRKKWLSIAFNTSILDTNRMVWVDYLKGFTILLVVYRHVLIGLQRSEIVIPPSLITANLIFFSFRMPLFFILSGIFISLSLAKKSLAQIIFSKFENLLYPYFVWSFIQISLQILFPQFTNSYRGLYDYLYIIIEPKALDQFWYLPALFNCTVIYVVLKVKFKTPNWVQLLLGIILYYLAPYLNVSTMLTDWMSYYIFFAVGDAASSLFFENTAQQFLRNKFSFLLMIPIFIFAQIYYLNHQPGINNLFGLNQQPNLPSFLLIALIGCLFMFIIAFYLEKWKILLFLRIIGYHSIFIYVMHVIVSAFTRFLLVKILKIHSPIFLLFSGIATGVLIPIIIYNLFIKNKPGWFLFSLHRPEKYKLSKTSTPEVLHEKNA